MRQQSPKWQRQRLAELLAGIADRHGQHFANMIRAKVAALPFKQATLLLDLTLNGAEGFDEDMVFDLHNLGYETAEQVLAVSRLIQPSGHHRTAQIITSLGLTQERAQVLLSLCPHNTHLLSLADDKIWRRAMRLLPEEALRHCLQSTKSQTELWMAIVSAQDGHMRKRIKEFCARNCPYPAWIVSGHSLEELEKQVPSSRREQGLTRREVHQAVRTLNRGEDPEEKGKQDTA